VTASRLAFGAALAALLAVGSGGPASATPTARILLELRTSSSCDGSAVLRRAGATTVSKALRLYVLDGASAAEVVPRLRACGAVRFAVPDRPVGTLSVTEFADPLVSSEWWRAAIGVAALSPPGPGKPVTIVDSGVELTHPEFDGRIDLLALNTQEPQPLGGVHGTAVASLIGAPENGVGIVGVYPQALLQTWDAAPGSGSTLVTSQIVAGILAGADRGPGVINISLGSSRVESAIGQAIATATRKGMLVVAAAGNDGDTSNALSYPASTPHVLTVAATTQQNTVASFSSRSRFVDLAAPGQDITVASALDRSWDNEDGTSFSAPLVSGAAAWVWTVRPDLDASQLFEVMRRSATDIGVPGRDDASGYGLLNVPAALAYAPPVTDPMEPNDDMDYVRAGAVYAAGSLPLTTRVAPSAAVTARLTVFEDPRDVYPVFVPAKKTVTAKTTGAVVDLALWSNGTPSVTIPSPGRNRLARGITKTGTETVTYKNPGAAKVVYLAVTLAKGSREATYRVSVAAR
jgi:hypothetical protein